ncbi:MAG: hypothetical protein ACOC32_00790 [Nanoarchaeota archaeon]
MDINGRELSEELLDDLITKIKEKDELSAVPNEIVTDGIITVLKKDSNLLDKLLTGKKAPFKMVLKDVRASLHRIHGSFHTDIKQRDELLARYEKEKDDDIIVELLKTHASTKERLEIYENLYETLFRICARPDSILDIGCGLNPLSCIFMDRPQDVFYSAYDISQPDLDMVKRFFSLYGIEGTVSILNLFKARSENIFQQVGKHNICFLFKVLEIIEQTKSHKISENIIMTAPADTVVVSFPKRTMSGNAMRYPRRGWIEQMLRRLAIPWDIIDYQNEIFYVIFKSKQLEQPKRPKENASSKKASEKQTA